MELENSGAFWRDGSYYLAYIANDGALYVVYYYHGMSKGADTCSIWRMPQAQENEL